MPLYMSSLLEEYCVKTILIRDSWNVHLDPPYILIGSTWVVEDKAALRASKAAHLYRLAVAVKIVTINLLSDGEGICQCRAREAVACACVSCGRIYDVWLNSAQIDSSVRTILGGDFGARDTTASRIGSTRY
jgi:hypothetical protein